MTSVASTDAALARSSRTRRPRPEAVEPIYITGPVVVRQILVDPMARQVLTEEADTPALCAGEHASWDSWMSCVSTRLARDTEGRWFKRAKFHLRWRSVNDLKLRGELIRKGKPFRRFFHFAGGRALEAGDGKSALVVHGLRGRGHRSITRLGLAANEHVRSAALLTDGRVLVVTVAGWKNLISHLRFLLAEDHRLREPSMTYRYVPKRFLGPELKNAGMARRYAYVYCGARDETACEQIRLDGGIRYSQTIERDRGVTLAVSDTGEKVAVYAFGTLYLYRLAGTELSLLRRWADIFYQDKDSHFTRPGLQWDPSGRWLAMSSSVRLNLVVDTQSGRVMQLRDHSLPFHHGSLFRPGRRGATFLGGSRPKVMLGDLRGGLWRVDPLTQVESRFKLPEAKSYDPELSTPDMIAYLQRCGDYLVAWRDGAVYVLDDQSMRLRARMGTYDAEGWSRLLSTLSLP